VLISAATLSGIKFFSGENDWTCKDGQWVRHGSPFAPRPKEECIVKEDEKKIEEKTEEKEPAKDEAEIKIDSPMAEEKIASSVEIVGQARGYWFFEASFPIKIVDANGKILASGPAQAKSDWMTEDFVPFSIKLDLSNPTATSGYIIFERDNPSGLKELEKTYRLPVVLPAPKEEMTVKIFLGSKKLNPNSEDCSLVFPVERRIVKTISVAKAALEELLKDINSNEAEQEYYSSINSGVKINSLAIASGTAWVDFDNQMEKEVGGSCRVAAIRSQIESTLKQFPTVKKVVISVEGKVEDALQP
jgi:hypothetical protein